MMNTGCECGSALQRGESKVINTRISGEAHALWKQEVPDIPDGLRWRTRKCLSCGQTFQTVELTIEALHTIAKAVGASDLNDLLTREV